LEIKLSDKLKEYLANKKISYVTIYPVELKHSDFTPKLPTVLTGKPKNIDEFQAAKIDDTTFFIHKSLYIDTNSLSLQIRNFLFMKEIYVDGWDITN